MATEKAAPLPLFGRRLSRHSGIYAAGSIATFVFAMVNVGVLTRLLPIEEFGRLAIYLTIAALLTTIYNLGTLQGVLIMVFGVADGEEGMALDDAEGRATATDPERALTTGVLLTVAIAALGTVVMFGLAPLVAELFGTPGQAEAVRLAALCGATGAVWRLVHNVARLERRPVVYSALAVVRPAFALAVGISLVVAGLGVEGALAGVALGTALAIPVAILAGRRNYAMGLELGIVPDIFRQGAFVIPIIAAMWIITNVDLFLVSAYAPADKIGPYRVAMRLGAGVSYVVGAVSMAWLPLKRTPLHTAMSELHGPSGFGGTLISVFLLFCIWVILGLALLADVLIGIAPESYSDAAPLVPLIGLGVVASGMTLMIYRGAKFPNRRRSYIGLLLGAAVVFVVAGLVLVPLFGGYGAAIAQILAFGGAALAMLWMSKRSEHPLPIQYRRLARGTAIGLLCIGLGQLVSPLAGQWRIAVDLLILAAFPALLVAARAFPTEELRAFVDLSLPRRPRRRSTRMVERLRQLDPLDRRALVELVPNGSSSAEVARTLELPEPVVLSRFLSSLREVGSIAATAGNGDEEDGEGEEAENFDADLAAYLLASRGVATRDYLAEKLCEEGVDPLDLDLLDVTLGRLRRIPRREWERLAS